MKRRPQPEPQLAGPGQQPVVHQHRVLSVRQQQPLFQLEVVHLVMPDGQSHAQREFLQKGLAVQGHAVLGQLLSAQQHLPVAGQVQFFRQVIEHDRAAERHGQGRGQQGVIAARAGRPPCRPRSLLTRW